MCLEIMTLYVTERRCLACGTARDRHYAQPLLGESAHRMGLLEPFR